MYARRHPARAATVNGELSTTNDQDARMSAGI